LEVPDPSPVEEKAVVKGSHGTDRDALTAEFAVEGPVKVGTDFGLDPPTHKRDFVGSHHFVADADTHAAEDAPVDVPLDERRDVIGRSIGFLPFERVIGNAVLVDIILQLALSPGVAYGTFQRMGNEDQLELDPAGFDDLWGVGQDFHPVADRVETGGD